MKSPLLTSAAARALTIPLIMAMSRTRLPAGPPETPALPSPEAKLTNGGNEGRPSILEVKLDAAYTSGGEAEFRGGEYGDSDAFHFNFSAGSMLPLSGRWMAPLKLKAQYLGLDDRPGAPIPDSINTLEIGTGLGFRPSDRWTVMGMFNTSLYRFEDLGSGDIGFSGGLMIKWDYSDSWKWVLGALYQPDNDLPVIPLAGFEWKINDRWDLKFPYSPRLTYTPGDEWSFFVGVDMVLGTTFRTSDTFGTSIGLPEFDGELGSYREFRLGAGSAWRLSESLRLEAEAGYSMGRSIEYPDIDRKVKFDDSPYVRVGLKYEF